MLEGLPAVRAADQHAADRGQDAPADGGQARTRWRSGLDRGAGAFSPEPQVLEKGEGELAQERVVVQATPGATFEMVQPQLVLELLVHLFADPSSAARSIRCRRHGRLQPAEGVP